MKSKPILKVVAFSLVMLLPFSLGISTRGADDEKHRLVPERFCTKLKTLFEKYYPKATFTDRGVNGIQFEYEVTTFEFPNTGAQGAKNQATTRQGPKKGGISCNVFGQKGKYMGQLALSLVGKERVGSQTIDYKIFKQKLLAPYSSKEDMHLWVALSFPPETNEEFLKEFHAVLAEFEKDVE